MQSSTAYDGPMTAHPNPRHLATLHGELGHQSGKVQAGIVSLREGRTSRHENYCPLPNLMTLQLKDNEGEAHELTLYPHGDMCSGGGNLSDATGRLVADESGQRIRTARIIASRDQDEGKVWAIIDIRGQSITAQVMLNPKTRTN